MQTSSSNSQHKRWQLEYIEASTVPRRDFKIAQKYANVQVPWLCIHVRKFYWLWKLWEISLHIGFLSQHHFSAIATVSYCQPHSYADLITFFFLKDCLIFWYLGNKCNVAKSCGGSFAKTYLWRSLAGNKKSMSIKPQCKNQKHHKCHAFRTMAIAQQINHAKELLQCHVQKLWSVPGRANDLRAATQQLPSITQRNWTCRAGCQGISVNSQLHN